MNLTLIQTGREIVSKYGFWKLFRGFIRNECSFMHGRVSFGERVVYERDCILAVDLALLLC